jgi:hypothetical protein
MVCEVMASPAEKLESLIIDGLAVIAIDPVPVKNLV